MTHFSQNVLGALKEAVVRVFWKKDDVRTLFEVAEVPIEGFSEEGISAYLQGARPRLVCVDGSDLFMVHDGRIDLADLFQRKKDTAVQKKKIYISANDIILGKSLIANKCQAVAIPLGCSSLVAA
jgi:hypothetical protein